MPTLYKRIIQLITDASLSLSHELAIDTSGNDSATKATLQELSDLIDADIRGDIIDDAETQTITAIEANGGLVPVGSIQMFGGSSTPDGWVFCDNDSLLRAGTYAELFSIIGTTFGSVDGTHFNVPDFRGIFPRGVGTSDKLLNANGAAFTGTLGTYQDDKMQGHHHNMLNDVGAGGATSIAFNGSRTTGLDPGNFVTDPVSSGVDGTPRTGTETNPANLGINFIIKY